jgi:hypothetical protein
MNVPARAPEATPSAMKIAPILSRGGGRGKCAKMKRHRTASSSDRGSSADGPLPVLTNFEDCLELTPTGFGGQQSERAGQPPAPPCSRGGITKGVFPSGGHPQATSH